jgi:hypothetical protein
LFKAKKNIIQVTLQSNPISCSQYWGQRMPNSTLKKMADLEQKLFLSYEFGASAFVLLAIALTTFVL